jgi:valyl-tRNA synthetase
MAVYKLFWDAFSSWYLELVKPAYQQPIDAQTYRATLDFFDALLRLLHPFMPFITEELWQALELRQTDESVMIAPMPVPLEQPERDEAESYLQAFETAKDLIVNIRSIRLQNTPVNKESWVLQVLGQHDHRFDPVVMKIGNISEICRVTEKEGGAVSFLVHTSEYAIPIKTYIDIEAEKMKLEAEIHYLEGFLASIMDKLGNTKFMANAKPQVIENELKKKADTESKLQRLRNQWLMIS